MQPSHSRAPAPTQRAEERQGELCVRPGSEAAVLHLGGSWLARRRFLGPLGHSLLRQDFIPALGAPGLPGL